MITEIYCYGFRSFYFICSVTQIKSCRCVLPTWNRVIKRCRCFVLCWVIRISDFYGNFKLPRIILILWNSICICPTADNVCIFFFSCNIYILTDTFYFAGFTFYTERIFSLLVCFAFTINCIIQSRISVIPWCWQSVWRILFKSWIFKHIVVICYCVGFKLNSIKIHCTCWLL